MPDVNSVQSKDQAADPQGLRPLHCPFFIH